MLSAHAPGSDVKVPGVVPPAAVGRGRVGQVAALASPPLRLTDTGTPVCPALLPRRAHSYRAVFGDTVTNYFAVKALPNPSVLRALVDSGCGLDCSSTSELHIAKARRPCGSPCTVHPPRPRLPPAHPSWSSPSATYALALAARRCGVCVTVGAGAWRPRQPCHVHVQLHVRGGSGGGGRGDGWGRGW